MKRHACMHLSHTSGPRPPGWVGHKRRRAAPPSARGPLRRRSTRQSLVALAIGVLGPLTSLAAAAVTSRGVSPWLTIPLLYLLLGVIARTGTTWAIAAPE